MIPHVPSRARFLWASLVVAVLWGCSDAPGPIAPSDFTRHDSYWTPGEGQEPFKVLTQNVYLGGDTGPLFSIDFSNVPAILRATNAFWAQVQASQIPERAAAIVDQIDARRPHLVGLQEVVRFAVFDMTTMQVVGGADLLAAIQAEIGTRGLPYEVVHAQETTSSALPLAVGATGITKLLSFTDRVVALRRTDVPVVSSDAGRYAAAFSLGPVTLERGWVRVSTERDGTPVHFVVTHLETQGLAPVQAAQLQELMDDVMAGLQGLTVLVGDLNSDAAASPGDRSWTATYDRLLDAGFVDAWKQAGHPRGEVGYTCCQAVDLRNDLPELDERIDFILLRTEDGAAWRMPSGIRIELIGEEQEDRTDATGLWPADHAGLAAGLRVPLVFPERDPR